MRKNLLLLSALLFIMQQQVNAQCTASITNVPHGDCAYTDIEMIASGGGTANGFTYEWTGPQGFTSTDQTAIVYYAHESASGMYKVIITDPLGCTAADSLSVIKHPSPTVYTGGQSSGCFGETTYIYANDYSGNYGPYTYLWDNGATTQTLPIIHGGGMYPAPACFITNIFGCKESNYTTFMIFTLPNPASPIIEALSATTFCEGGTVKLTTANDPNLTYQWYKHGNLINGATSSDYVAKNSARLSLTVTSAVNCSAKSNMIQTTMISNPDAAVAVNGSLNICNGETVLLTAPAGNGLTYQWRKHVHDIAGASLNSFNVSQAGNYRVMVSNQQGCTKMSPVTTVTDNCKLESPTDNSEKVISIYPNPSVGYFNLQLKQNDLAEKAQLIITDVIGSKIAEYTLDGAAADFQFGEKLPAGIYFASLIKNNDTKTIRIVKTE
ncbi:MAG: T9SS type A sorting domain-containing protein [Bacteroidia bacterium]